MDNILLVDYIPPKNWAFCKGLEESTGKRWIVNAHKNNEHGSPICSIRRYFGYFFIPFITFVKKNRYENILAWQQFYGINFAFFCKLFNAKSFPKVTIQTFIYKSRQGLIGSLYKKYICFALSSRCIKNIIVFSKYEEKLYSELLNIPKELIKVEQLGIDIDNQTGSCGDYYIAAGRSNRDYEWLITNWPSDRKLKILNDSISKKHQLNNEKITVLDNCHGEEYLHELANSRAVIVPLMNEEISSGQLVILQSMMFGKPIIATQNESLYDYISNYETGLVIRKNQQNLVDALEYIEDKENYKRLANNEKIVFFANYTSEELGKRIGRYI